MIRFIAYAALAGGLTLVGLQAPAQDIGGVPFARLDINGDHRLDAAELMAAFDDAGLGILSRDLDGDGMVTRQELRATRRLAKDDESDRSGESANPGAARGDEDLEGASAEGDATSEASVGSGDLAPNRGNIPPDDGGRGGD